MTLIRISAATRLAGLAGFSRRSLRGGSRRARRRRRVRRRLQNDAARGEGDLGRAAARRQDARC